MNEQIPVMKSLKLLKTVKNLLMLIIVNHVFHLITWKIMSASDLRTRLQNVSNMKVILNAPNVKEQVFYLLILLFVYKSPNHLAKPTLMVQTVRHALETMSSITLMM